MTDEPTVMSDTAPAWLAVMVALLGTVTVTAAPLASVSWMVVPSTLVTLPLVKPPPGNPLPFGPGAAALAPAVPDRVAARSLRVAPTPAPARATATTTAAIVPKRRRMPFVGPVVSGPSARSARGALWE